MRDFHAGAASLKAPVPAPWISQIGLAVLTKRLPESCSCDMSCQLLPALGGAFILPGERVRLLEEPGLSGRNSNFQVPHVCILRQNDKAFRAAFGRFPAPGLSQNKRQLQS